MGMVRSMRGSKSDFVASFLRAQLVTLQNILTYIENSQRIEYGYVEESLRRMEKEICRLRKFCGNN